MYLTNQRYKGSNIYLYIGIISKKLLNIFVQKTAHYH